MPALLKADVYLFVIKELLYYTGSKYVLGKILCPSFYVPFPLQKAPGKIKKPTASA